MPMMPRKLRLAAALTGACLAFGCAPGSTGRPKGSTTGGSAPPQPPTVWLGPCAESTNVKLLEVSIGPYQEYPNQSIRTEVIAWLAGVIKLIGPDGTLTHPKLEFRAFDSPISKADDPVAGYDHYVVVDPAPGWNTLIVPVRSDLTYDNTGLDNRFVNGNVVGDYLVGKPGLGVRATHVRCLSSGCYLGVDLSQPIQAGQTLSGALSPLDASGQEIAFSALSLQF